MKQTKPKSRQVLKVLVEALEICPAWYEGKWTSTKQMMRHLTLIHGFHLNTEPWSWPDDWAHGLISFGQCMLYVKDLLPEHGWKAETRRVAGVGLEYRFEKMPQWTDPDEQGYMHRIKEPVGIPEEGEVEKVEPYPDGHLDETGKVVFTGGIVPGSEKPYHDKLREAFNFGLSQGKAIGSTQEKFEQDAVREFEERFLK